MPLKNNTMAIDCATLPILLGLWFMVYGLALPYLLAPTRVHKWREATSRISEVEPWVILATICSSTFHISGTVCGCINGAGIRGLEVFFGFLIIFETLAALLWVRKTSDQHSPALLSIAGYIITAVLLSSTLYLFGDTLEGTLILLAAIFRVPMFVLIYHTAPL
tara:strand:+ start:6443 stop:6934 length:492 start_codon:yes stop_codon:yes gene_type:complete